MRAKRAEGDRAKINGDREISDDCKDDNGGGDDRKGGLMRKGIRVK